MVIRFNKAVTDTAAELLGKQRQKRKPWVTPEILDLCDQRRDLKKKRGEPEGAKDYREIKRKIRTEMKMAKETWIQGQCQEVEACPRKNNSEKAYQLVKDLTTEKQGKTTTIKDKSGSVSQRKMKSLTGGQSTAQTFTTILAKSSNRPLTYQFSSKPKNNLAVLFTSPNRQICLSTKGIKRFDKTLNITSRMRRWTQVLPFLEITKFSIWSQFVKDHFLKYPIFRSKTTLSLNHMTSDTIILMQKRTHFLHGSGRFGSQC